MVIPRNSSETIELINIIEIDDLGKNIDPIKEKLNTLSFDCLYKIECEKNGEVDKNTLQYSEIFSNQSEGYLLMERYDIGIEYQKMMVRFFIRQFVEEMYCLAGVVDIFGEYHLACYITRKSNNTIGKIQIELIDNRAVLRKNLKDIKSYNMGITKLTIVMNSEEINCLTYRTNNPEIIAFRRLPHQFTIDMHYGRKINAFKNIDDSIEGKIFLPIEPTDDFDDINKKLAMQVLNHLTSDGALRRVYNNNKICFSSIGLKRDDEIKFKNDSKQIFIVHDSRSCSNTIRYIDEPENSYTLKEVTKRLLELDFIGDTDIFEHWTYKGKTLRAIFEEKKALWVVPIEFDLEAEYYENFPHLKKKA